jgi:hypothetical protein
MSRPLPTEWLIDEPCVLAKPDGCRVATAIRIGFPYQLGGEALPDNYESHCWARVEGLVEIPGPMIGGSTLSALIHALEIVATLAAWRMADDGELVDGADESYSQLLAPFCREPST